MGGFNRLSTLLKSYYQIKTVKAKIKRDAAPSRSVTTGATEQLHQNIQKLRAAVLEKASQGMTPATPDFDGTCVSLRGRGIVFYSADLHVERFKHVRREIYEYVGKEYMDVGGVWWTLKQ